MRYFTFDCKIFDRLILLVGALVIIISSLCGSGFYSAFPATPSFSRATVLGIVLFSGKVTVSRYCHFVAVIKFTVIRP